MLYRRVYTIFSSQLGSVDATVFYIPCPNHSIMLWEVPASWKGNITDEVKNFNVHQSLAHLAWWCAVCSRERNLAPPYPPYIGYQGPSSALQVHHFRGRYPWNKHYKDEEQEAPLKIGHQGADDVPRPPPHPVRQDQGASSQAEASKEAVLTLGPTPQSGRAPRKSAYLIIGEVPQGGERTKGPGPAASRGVRRLNMNSWMATQNQGSAGGTS
eukprot:81166-Amphidinium_carterae.2